MLDIDKKKLFLDKTLMAKIFVEMNLGDGFAWRNWYLQIDIMDTKSTS